jgi:hypothetical protein
LKLKYLVKVNSLNCDEGSFSRGDVIDLTVERIGHFDPNDIQLIPEEIAVLTQAPTEELLQIKVDNVKRVRKTVKNSAV